MAKFLYHVTGEWIVDTPKGFAKADAHVDLESIDNFVINANFDSDKIKHRKIHAEIANKPTPKNGKLITMAVTSDGKNIVTGRYFPQIFFMIFMNRLWIFKQIYIFPNVINEMKRNEIDTYSAY